MDRLAASRRAAGVPPGKASARSVTQQFLQLLARRGRATLFLRGRNKHAADKLEVFAKVANVFFEDRLRATVPALVRRARVVAQAIQANPQVGPALRTALTPPRLPGQRPFPSAFPAMPRHPGECRVPPCPGNPPGKNF